MPISVELSSETEKRLNILLAKTGRLKSECLQEIIENGLEDLEDYYLANSVLERVKNGEEAIFSSHEVRKELGLEN